MNAKIKRMSRRRAKKAVAKIYTNLMHAYLRKALGNFEGKKINRITMDDISTAIKNSFPFFESIEAYPNDANSILVTLSPQLESINLNLYQPTVRLVVTK